MKKVLIILCFFSLAFGKALEKFDEFTYYDTLLKTSLGANDLSTASKVVELALKEMPNNTYFLEWAYKIALWRRDLDNALRYALTLYKKEGRYDETMLELFKLKGLIQEPIEIYERELSKGNWKFLDSYVYYILDTVQFDRGMGFLKELYQKSNNVQVLKHIALLSYQYGLPDYEVYVKAYLEVDPNWEVGYRILADYYFANRNFKKSLEYLLSYKLLKEKKGEEVERDVLLSISLIAWGIGEKEIAFNNSMNLVDRGLATYDNYLIVTDYLLKENPKKALELSLEGYNKFKNEFFLLRYLLAADKVGWQRDYIEKMEKLVDVESLAFGNPTFLYFYTKGLIETGNKRKALSIYEKILQTRFDDEVLKSYTWLVIDVRDFVKLEKILKTYEEYVLRSDRTDLKIPFVSGWLMLQDSLSAQRIFTSIKGPLDDSDRYTYSYILELSGRTEEARFIRYSLFEKLKKVPVDSLNSSELEMLLNLYREFDPVSYERMKERFKDRIRESNYWEMYLAHLINLEEHEKFKEVAIKHSHSVRSWMELMVAIVDWDKDKQMKLLEESLVELPIRDKVTAAERSVNKALAKDLAFQGLEKNREDYLLYNQFRDLYMNSSNKFYVESDFLSSKFYSLVSSKIGFKYMVSDVLITTLNSILSVYHSKDQGVIYNLPSSDLEISVEPCYEIQKGQICGSFGVRNAIKEVKPIELSLSYYLQDRLNLYISFGKDIKADDSVYTLIAGKKNEVAVRVSYTYNRASLSLSYFYDRIFSQDGYKVGSASKFNIDAYYKLRIGYPDFTFRTYYQNNFYQEKEGHKGFLNNLTPIPNYRFLPQSYWQAGLEMSFGYDNKFLYTRTARPFINMGLGYNNLGGLLYKFSGGYGFNFLKSDNLAVEFGFSRNIGRFKETNYVFSVMYNKWF